MKVKYKTDYCASYMLVEIPQEADREQYSFKMLEKNKIKGILSCKERLEDGVAYLYMDISGKKNLIQEYNEKEMVLEDMIVIFQQLLSLLEELRKYLLTEKMAVLQPEFIFRDMEDGDLYITVLPWERKEELGLHGLAEFFLEKINHKDEYGVNAAYHFYKQQSQPQFSFYHFIPVLEKESILKRKQKKDLNDINPLLQQEDLVCKQEIEDYDLVYKENSEDEKKEEKQYTANNNKKFGILCLLFSIVFFVCSFIPLIKINQKIACYLIAFLFLIIGSLIILIGTKKKAENKNEIIMQEEITEDKNIFIENGMEETIFFDNDLSEDLLKLQWKEKGRIKQKILRDLPCTLGKLNKEVSIVIENPSVSRIHCRFVEKDGGVAIMDLNSTNGTFLNGIRLEEGEILEIVKNDEILIGKVKILVV